MTRIALIGCGPMALYALKRLIAHPEPLEITIFEASDQPGAGMPYSDRTTSDQMLCNAFSREIPPLTRPLIDWMRDQPEEVLQRWSLLDEDPGARDFFPRTLLGAYFRAELAALTDKADAAGHRVEVLANRPVTDIRRDGDGFVLTGATGHQRFETETDHVVIATGHRWPEQPEIDGVPLIAPWPADRLATLPPGSIGILGSSLSGIDAVLALADAHGRFEPGGAELRWFPRDGAEELRITLLSHKGVMPEADFFYAFPYEPLTALSETALEAERQRGSDGLLDRVFALLLEELHRADETYLAEAGPDARTVEGFAPAYFAHRAELGGLRAVRDSFRTSRDAMARKETIPHRYVLLRADAAFDTVLRHLDAADFERFRTHLLPVFADAYAAVPHLSVERLLALHQAGALELQATGTDARYAARPEGGVEVTIEGETLVFDTMIDARGQQAAPLPELPFPSLAARLDNTPITAPFLLDGDDGPGRAYCLALPQLLERHPFSQGLANCAELSTLAMDDLRAHLTATPAAIPLPHPPTAPARAVG